MKGESRGWNQWLGYNRGPGLETATGRIQPRKQIGHGHYFGLVLADALSLQMNRKEICAKRSHNMPLKRSHRRLLSHAAVQANRRKARLLDPLGKERIRHGGREDPFARHVAHTKE